MKNLLNIVLSAALLTSTVSVFAQDVEGEQEATSCTAVAGEQVKAQTQEAGTPAVKASATDSE